MHWHNRYNNRFTNCKEYYMNIHEWDDEEYERPMTRCKSARTPRTPRTPRAMSPRRRISGMVDEEERRVMRNNEKNRRPSTARIASARDPPRSACSRNSSSILNRPAFTVY